MKSTELSYVSNNTHCGIKCHGIKCLCRGCSNEMHNLNGNNYYDKTNINSCAFRNILLFSQSPFQLLLRCEI